VKNKFSPRLRFALVVSIYILLAFGIALMMLAVDTGGWAGVDADRFHEMARLIINGFTPYVSFVDPKPPLLFFVVALMDLPGAGLLDLPVITSVNILCALLIFAIGNRDYGFLSGFSAGALYLVVAAFTQGYFLFSEQFAILFVLLAFICARNDRYILAGIGLGLACGFKQYAVLALIPLLYLMYASGNRQYHRLLIPAGAACLAAFGLVWLIYGNIATLSALYWTFGIAPAYTTGSAIALIPSYQTSNLFAYSVALISSIFVVIPVLMFALTSVARRGLRTPSERALFLFAAVFFVTIFIRQYLHYWLLILPFLVLLACREFADDAPDGPGQTGSIRIEEHV
jgi:hypothetical protein